MAKTKEELNQLKTEYETLNNKLKELTEDELREVTGGGKNDKDKCQCINIKVTIRLAQILLKEYVNNASIAI